MNVFRIKSLWKVTFMASALPHAVYGDLLGGVGGVGGALGQGGAAGAAGGAAPQLPLKDGPAGNLPVNDLAGGLPTSGLLGGGLADLLNIDLDNLGDGKQLVGLGGDRDDTAIAVLAKKRAKEQGIPEDQAKKEVEKDLVKREVNAREKAEQDRIAGRLNAFHVYGMQSVGQTVRPQWTMLFDNAFTANAYMSKVEEDYKDYYSKSRKGCVPRPHPQIFIFPHGVGPEQLEPVKGYADFTGKLFFNPVDRTAMQLPVLPVQDKFGYIVHSSD